MLRPPQDCNAHYTPQKLKKYWIENILIPRVCLYLFNIYSKSSYVYRNSTINHVFLFSKSRREKDRNVKKIKDMTLHLSRPLENSNEWKKK